MEKKMNSQKKIFDGVISALHRQIKSLEGLMPKLEKKEKELKEFEKTLGDHVDNRTSAERIIHRQLHHEIEKRKKLEKEIEDALEYANAIINTVRDSLVVLDEDLKVVSASPSFYKTFKVDIKDTEKQHIYDLGSRQWDIPKLRELLEDILPNVTSFDDFEVEHDFPLIGKRKMLLNARKIYRKAQGRQFILLAIEDITLQEE